MYGVQLSSQVWAPKALYSYCLRPICSEEVGMRFFLMRTFRKALRALCYLASLILYLPLCNRIVRATLPTRQLEVSIFYNNSFHFSFVLLLFSVGCSLSAQYREQSKKCECSPLLFCVNQHSIGAPHVQQAGSICIKNLKLKNIPFVVNSFYPKKWKGIF